MSQIGVRRARWLHQSLPQRARGLALLTLLTVAATLLNACSDGRTFTRAAPLPADMVMAYTAEDSSASATDSVIGLRGRDGTQAWSREIGRRDNKAPIVVGGILYAEGETQPAPSTAVVAVRLSDGTLLWRTYLPSDDGPATGIHNFNPYLAADNSTVIVAAGPAGLYALDTAHGAIRWHGAGIFNGPVFINAGTIVTPLSDGPARPGLRAGLVALRESNGTALWQPNFSVASATNSIAAYGTEGDDSYALALANGKILWDFQSGVTNEGGGADNYHGTVTAVSNQLALVQTAYPVVSNDLPSRDYLLALDALTGKTRWRSSQTFDSAPVFVDPTTKETTIVGWHAGALTALRSSDGKTIWQAKFPDYLHGNLLNMFASGGVVFAYLEPAQCDQGPCIGQPSYRLVVLDGATGLIYWQRELSNALYLQTAGSA